MEVNNTPVFKLNQPDDQYKFLPLPAPTGNYPYHLNIDGIVPDPPNQKMVFHMAGDTGNVKPDSQVHLIVAEMAAQCNVANEENRPQFLFHLGDIVYHHGEADRYEKQFFKPFEQYPAPIFAIAGNHDSDVNPISAAPYQSLDAYTAVFCDTASRPISFSGGAVRKSMVQPNPYFRLKTPLANIIGLHTNIPKYGMVTAEQRAWFVNELITADAERPDKALLLCLHHAPYSADTNHGSSLPMITLLNSVFEETGIKPDMVFSGHVHNYQRFHKLYADGIVVPFIVAGAGGFDELNAIAIPDDIMYTNKSELFDDVNLKAYRDREHGFLRMSIEKQDAGLSITGAYYTVALNNGKGIATLADQFTIPVSQKQADQLMYS
ncbi:metallophosphoesterase family protein [Mucilaginibacter dorajii]|uniref:Calcineurin-like phosphoesterase domain-containing protein n=1 Tax=Mucilaginibacter dorajii TaxID=692994 RepID=A0ABP7P517_9SPHI|nr:metallophosphoesterase [Mucilaginibacter dorajii]MCS3734452.1 calcineurin-like phosphoesterase family protein [Mucilaginibacter dorajii]